MATIKIQRSNEYINRLRDYQIFVDGQKIDTIANGQIKEIQVSAGQHKIFAKIDWVSSQELSLDLAENETKTLHIAGFKNSKWLMALVILIIVPHEILKWVFHVDSIWYYILPTIFAGSLFFHLSFGRKKYLILTEQITN